MDNGGAIPGQSLFLDDIDKFKGAADGGVWVRPLGTLKVPDFQDVVILQRDNSVHLCPPVAGTRSSTSCRQTAKESRAAHDSETGESYFVQAKISWDNFSHL